MKKNYGVYAIVNSINGKMIIGDAQDIDKRWSNYLSELKKGTYGNWKLQEDVNTYGIEAFEFVVLDRCKKKADLLAREKYWIDLYWDTGVLYNINRVNKTTKKLRRGKEAKNHKQKMSKVFSGMKNPRYKGLLPDEDVKEIKVLLKYSNLSNKEIHKFFKDKTRYDMISRIKTGDRRKDVTIDDLTEKDINAILAKHGCIQNGTSFFIAN